MTTRYPVFLDLAGRRVLIVGGGAVALRRARDLVAGGAEVGVIAPRVLPELAQIATRVSTRRYEPGDIAGAWLVVACADSAEVNAAVAADAERDRVWCIRADDAVSSAAWVPAVTQAGDVTVAVSAGGDPRRAVRLRDAVAVALASGELPLRRSRPGSGRVALVGGGPGDPDLITVRGRRLVAEADVVVADRLAPRALLDGLDPDVEVIDAGKARGDHAMRQREINEILVSRARAGRRVVRLKGGDPFVFGRGGEEALACIEAGVPVEVVPGVTSAVAVPAYAGIPVTHRGVAQEFAVISGHLEPDDPACTVDWTGLARSAGTLVLLMGLAHLERLAKELIVRGRPEHTPVAVISSGTMPEERTVVGSLDDIAQRAADADLASPAVIVVGDVVRLRDRMRAGQ